MVRKAVPKDPEMDSQLAWKALLDRVNQLLVPDFFFRDGGRKTGRNILFWDLGPAFSDVEGKAQDLNPLEQGGQGFRGL